MSTHEFDTSEKTDFQQPSQAEMHQPEQTSAPWRNQLLDAGLGAEAHAALLQRTAATQPARAGQIARQLQRQYGNRYVAQLAMQARQPGLVVQPKLIVTSAGDQYEQEADRVAAQVMREITTPTSRPSGERDPQSVQRTPDLVQRQTAEPLGGTPVEPGLEASIQAARGGGQALPNPLRGKLEQSFGADFSDVKVHSGVEADQLNRALEARAFTTGRDIFFRQDDYNPGSSVWQQLLAHELTHVIQQNNDVIRRKYLGRWDASHQLPMRAKATSEPDQRALPVNISAAMPAGDGSYKIVAGAGQQQVGSVMVHEKGETSIEVTDLGVEPSHRKQGLGGTLMASALHTGRRLRKSKVSLASQDDGSGRLTDWYRRMGFVQVGINQLGYPQLEAPISRILAGVVQRRLAPLRIVQRMKLRSADQPPIQPSVSAGVPSGYMNLQDFDKATHYRYMLAGLVNNPTEIYAKVYNNRVFLWWANPAIQVDDFVYFGNRDDDISLCNLKYGRKNGYTWHHTGYPHDEQKGTMQLVPTKEHEALPHVGGVAISKGKI